MAWSSLASNQMVSYTDAQGGGFTLKSGQSSVTSNQCMTKLDALTKYNLDPAYMSAYADNKLVPKSTWVALVGAPTFSWQLNRVSTVGGGVLTITKNGTLVVTSSTNGATGTVTVAAGDVMVMKITQSAKATDTTGITLYNNGLIVAQQGYDVPNVDTTVTYTLVAGGIYLCIADQYF